MYPEDCFCALNHIYLHTRVQRSENISFVLPLQSRRSPDTSWPRSSSVTVRTSAAGTRRRRQTKTTWSSSTTECPRRRARPSPTSPTTCVGRTASTCCTSTRPKTTRSCPCRTRSDSLAAPRSFYVCSVFDQQSVQVCF